MRRTRCLRHLALAIACALLSHPARASDGSWIASSGGDFFNSGNWAANIIPGPSDTAFFNYGGIAYDITFSADAATHRMVLLRDHVNFDLQGHQYILGTPIGYYPPPTLSIGESNANDASLQISNGALTAPDAIIGNDELSTGSLSITTQGRFDSGPVAVTVGNAGDGRLTVEHGGLANGNIFALAKMSGSTAILSVADAGSRLSANQITVGAGSAQISVRNGGLLIGDGYIGNDDASNSIATVDGPGSIWGARAHLVGWRGNGTLNITNGGKVQATDGYISGGEGSHGSVNVAGNGSAWSIEGHLYVGSLGQGSMSITNGALVENDYAIVGQRPQGSGTVKLTGNGSQWRTRSLYIGGDGGILASPGLVSVEDGGVLTATSLIRIFSPGMLQNYGGAISVPRIELRGGLFSGYGALPARIENSGGTLHVPAGQILTASGAFTSTSSAILTKTGDGKAVFNGSQSHASGAELHVSDGDVLLNSNAGVAASATSPAVANLSLLIDSQAAAITLGSDQVLFDLSIDVTDPARQSFDLNSPSTRGSFRSLRIYSPLADKAALWNALTHANRPGSFDPQDGIFDSGIFSHPNSRVGLAQLNDLHGDSHLLIRPTRIGDLNLDGAVTISDFIDLASHFDQSGPNITWQEGDINYDNAVTISDFLDLASNFGASYTGETIPISPQDQQLLSSFASAYSASVPEPSLLLLLTPALLMCRRTRTRLP
jgi:T5SS/PEP-CTERM-associated repeat protein